MKRIEITGKPAPRIIDTSKPMRRIDPEELAKALGAEPVGEPHRTNMDPIELLHLGSELLKPTSKTLTG
jgi:hypothetical protein